VIATDPGTASVMLENGDVLQNQGAAPLKFVGNLLGGLTPRDARTGRGEGEVSSGRGRNPERQVTRHATFCGRKH
jgi:hypothetical protein